MVFHKNVGILKVNSGILGPFNGILGKSNEEIPWFMEKS